MRRLPRIPQLVLSCVVLGVGVALLLRAALGSDGYSTFVNGASLALHLPFAVVNLVLGVVLVALAWWRGLTPGVGTVVQPVVVGFVVTATMDVISAPTALPARIGLLAGAFVILAVGVAGYLGSRTGAGPTEAAALAFDPPVPFRVSYGVVQGVGALGGWAMGAAVGPGTLVVIALLGPAINAVARLVPVIGTPAPRTERGRDAAVDTRDVEGSAC